MAKVTRHSAAFIAAFAITAVLNYAFGVALSWFLSPAEFGILGVAQSLLLLIALLVGSGFSWTAARDVAALGLNETTRRRWRTAWLANMILGCLLAGGLWAAYTTNLLPLGPAYRAIVVLVGLTTLVLAARSVINGVIQGLYRFGPVAVNLVGEVVVKCVAGLGLVAAGAGVAGAMGGFALGAAVALGHSLWLVRPARLWSGPGWWDGQVLRATVPLFAGMLGPALILNLDILGLKLLSPAGQGDELAGFYQAAIILSRIPVLTARSVMTVLFSYAAGQAAGGAGVAPTGYLAAIRTWSRLLLPVNLVLALAPQAVLTLLFPASYAAAAPALRLAAVGSALLALLTLLTGIAQATSQQRVPAVAAGVATLAQLITLAWLVPAWGSLGAALSLIVAGGVGLAWLAGHSRNGLAVLFGSHRLPLARPALKNAIPLLLLSVVLLLLPDGGRLAATFKLGLAGIVYLAGLAVFLV
ncbi:MAG: oligosaccharide flippase family protein, partial [Chloroflexi bacterium]|nr:oligosaccharide flippase family protein [Chloroflexota bacterium]